MRARASDRRGVTLLELLIAVTLLSLLSVGMLMAMRVGLSAMDKANARLVANRRVTAAERVLDQEIAGLMPVVAQWMAPGAQLGVRYPFFQGEPQSMRFVSAYSLEGAWRGYPRILEFQVIPGEKDKGVRLIVNEILYTGPLSAGQAIAGFVANPATGMQIPQFRPIEPGPRSFVLADKLAYCRFMYRETRPAPEFERWLPSWTIPRWPSGIRIEMAPLEPESSALRVLTLTAPVHINRVPMGNYAD